MSVGICFSALREFEGGAGLAAVVALGHCRARTGQGKMAMKSHTPECAKIEQFAATLIPPARGRILSGARFSDTMRWSGLTEHLSGVFVYGFILKELFFSLEPVVQFRTGLITSPEVEFVGPSPDSFFG